MIKKKQKKGRRVLGIKKISPGQQRPVRGKS